MTLIFDMDHGSLSTSLILVVLASYKRALEP